MILIKNAHFEGFKPRECENRNLGQKMTLTALTRAPETFVVSRYGQFTLARFARVTRSLAREGGRVYITHMYMGCIGYKRRAEEGKEFACLLACLVDCLLACLFVCSFVSRKTFPDNFPGTLSPKTFRISPDNFSGNFC